MVIDYSERRQVNRNRPKSRPVNLAVFLVIGGVLCIYFLGVATGLLYTRFLRKNPVADTTAAAPGKQKPVAPASGSATAQNTGSDKAKTSEPQLTFYYTLPKGEKVTALGSGLNPDKETDKPAPAKQLSNSDKTKHTQITAQHSPNAVKTELPATTAGHQAVSKDAIKMSDKATAEDTENSGKTAAAKKIVKSRESYTVQVASCTTRKEAEDIKTVLDRKGLPGYIVETKISGKGTFYRVRLGNHLDLETARKISGKAGKGAMPVPD